MMNKVKVGDKVRFKFAACTLFNVRYGMIAEVIKIPEGSETGYLFNPELTNFSPFYSFNNNPPLSWEKI